MAKQTSMLREFFEPQLREGPTDPTFAPPPEVEADPEADMAGGGMGGGAGMDPGMGGDPAMTQDVAKMSASSLSFFSKNVTSASQKYDLASRGFSPESLQQFATSLDDFVYQLYAGVQNPAARQSFEADYQKIAADWAKDLTSLFEKLIKLEGHADLA